MCVYREREGDQSVVAEIQRMKVHLTQTNRNSGQQIPTVSV